MNTLSTKIVNLTEGLLREVRITLSNLYGYQRFLKPPVCMGGFQTEQ